MVTDSTDRHIPALTQANVDAVPVHYVDAYVGIATAAGVARITFAAIGFNPAEGADKPSIRPVTTIIIPEASLLQFATDMLARAQNLETAQDDSAIS